MNPRRLYRSRRDRILAGVAGGMAEYLDLDPTVVRLLWILSIFFGGFGILVYIILAFVMPLEPEGAPAAGARPPAGPPPAGPWWGAPAAQPAWGAGTAAATASAPAGPVSGTEVEGDSTVAAPDPGGADGTADTTADATATATAAWPAAPGDPNVPAWGAAPAGWPAPQSAMPEAEHRPGRGGVILGVGLIVFGAVAAAGVAIPGLLGSGLLWAGVVVALGVALVVGALRRPETTA